MTEMTSEDLVNIQTCPYGYTFEHRGLLCRILPSPVCGLNGYVQVPESNYLHGKNYSDEIPMPEGWLELKLGDFGEAPPIIPAFIQAMKVHNNGGKIERNRVSLDTVIRVHGGISFSGPMDGQEGWWLGFDTGHAGDIDWSGGFRNLKSTRSEEYVIAHTERLAEEILAYDKMVRG